MFARLFLLFVTVPVIELFLFLVIGREIGIFPTFAIILLTGVLGAALARSQGLRTLSKYREAMAQGRLPHEAVLDGLMILVAGALLLTPGFLTDTIGFLLLAPGVRKVVRSRLEHSLRERVRFVDIAAATGFSASGANTGTRSGRGADGVITVEAEVVESHAYGEPGGR